MEKKFTIKEAAEKSGMSQSWWRLRILNKKIRYIKVGGRIFIPESTLDGIYTVVEPREEMQTLPLFTQA